MSGRVAGAGLRPLAWPAALRPAAAVCLESLSRWAAAERGRFALFLPLCMAGGAALYLLLTAEPAWWTGGACCGAAALACAATRRRAAARAVCAVALAAALGFASGQFAAWRAPPLLDTPPRAVVVSGIVRAVEALPEGRRVTLEAPVLTTSEGSAPPSVRVVRIRLHRGDALTPQTGDRLRVRVLLSRPSPPAYPGAWDLQRDSYFSGMGAYGFALGPAVVEAHANPSGPARWLQRAREAIAARVAAVLDGARAAIATTLLTGSTSSVPQADKQAFRDSGLAHLLAIAGLHIGIVMGLVFGAVRLALAASERAALHWPCKAIAALASLAVGAAYMALTGAHVPIIRSFAMACLFTVAVLAGRRAFSLRGWALAMAALVALAPNEVLGVSFQMSFSAVLALIAGYDALRPLLRRLRGDGGAWRRLLGFVLGLALTSALAGTASAPFGAYHFGRIQIYFVLANMAAVPLTALWVMPLGLLALALMPLHGEALALVPMGWGENGLLWIARRVAALPDATLAVPHIPGWGLVLIAAGGAWLGLWRTRLRLAGVALLAAGLASPLAVRPPDALVSADAGLIGLRTGAGVFVQAGRRTDKFTQEAWAQFWAAGPVVPMPDSGVAARGALVCGEDACRWRAPGGALVVVARTPIGAEDCSASVVLAPMPARLRCPARAGPVAIDRFSVWREGAYAVWLEPGGVRAVSEQMVRGDRPWAPRPGHARSLAGLTMAPTEPLPPE